ncbi:amino acid ABC transporter permease [Frigidibacter sp. MR17.14]|uniref:amino acid ABC transporter permease n=1 Tax=Frigidibacter sp. MR17.14 TaxID=3126509 RepID=UPI003012C36E
MGYDFDWSLILRILPRFQDAIWLTVKLYLCAQLLSIALAFSMAVAGNIWASRPLGRVLGFYSWLFRGLPELIVLLFCFLALPDLGLRLSSFQSAMIGLALVASAYEYEILRGALTSIPAQQYEASRALGFPPGKMWRRIIGPQLMRVALPSLLTFACTSLKRTSVASAVAVTEIMGMSRRLIDALQKPFELMAIAMVLYAVLSSIIMIAEVLARRRLALKSE